MIMSSKRTAIAGLFLGIACGLQMFVIEGLRIKFGVKNAGPLLAQMGHDFGLSVSGTVFDPGYWYVTTQEAQWVGWLFNKLGWNNMGNIYFGLNNGIPNPAINPADWMSLALIGGAAVMALLSNEFKFKKPPQGNRRLGAHRRRSDGHRLPPRPGLQCRRVLRARGHGRHLGLALRLRHDRRGLHRREVLQLVDREEVAKEMASMSSRKRTAQGGHGHGNEVRKKKRRHL